MVASSSPFIGSSLHLVGSKISGEANFPTCVRFCKPCRVFSSVYTAQEKKRTLFSSNMAMASPSTLYEVLGIPTSATCNEIKAAYRRLARTCHPDVAAMDLKEKFASEFMRIHAAYSTLSDPNKRAIYDEDLFRKRRPASLSYATSPSSSSFTRRNWETDQCW